jgi:hypothetical protein
MEDTIKISIKDMLKIGIHWVDYCEATGHNL